MSSEFLTHILVFPFPAQGHITPLLNFTNQLALRKLAITIVVTPKNLPILSPLLSAHPATVHALVLPFPAHPNIPAGVENLRDLGNSGNVAAINALSKLRDPIAQWIASHPNPPVAVVADIFLGWTKSLGIATVAFSSSNAFFAAVLDDAWLRLRAAGGPPPRRVKLPSLPRSPAFEYEHMSSLLRTCVAEPGLETDFAAESVLAGVSESWRCVFNTFEALEGEYLSHLRAKLGGERFCAVGPLNLLGDAGNQSRADVSAWLDGCVEGSVLYVCFGSQKVLKREQMEALALGLELSGVRFIWVVKPGTPEEAAEGKGLIPDGFEERVGKSRGRIIHGWAEQVAILGHRAVGGFLSHCGWNSVLEAVAMGVMMLAWPMEADQHVNARLLAEGVGVAVRVCEGADRVPDPVRLANAVAEAMAWDGPEKAKARELRDKARAAVGEGGCSLDELVRELRELPKPAKLQ